MGCSWQQHEWNKTSILTYPPTWTWELKTKLKENNIKLKKFKDFNKKQTKNDLIVCIIEILKWKVRFTKEMDGNWHQIFWDDFFLLVVVSTCFNFHVFIQVWMLLTLETCYVGGLQGHGDDDIRISTHVLLLFQLKKLNSSFWHSLGAWICCGCLFKRCPCLYLISIWSSRSMCHYWALQWFQEAFTLKF
jgi:hypothetical protein